ncbi:hypothetical protein JB92DRAFT_1967490 [Gautieria morchelliformis]|nr:hypothetical protein JB92DRAFT_1967490 [Gautieria morchelliformis]
MVFSNEDSHSTAIHPFWYARVLGVFHANIILRSSQGLTPPTRLEFLWVRWFGRDPSHSSGWNVRQVSSASPSDASHRPSLIMGSKRCHISTVRPKCRAGLESGSRFLGGWQASISVYRVHGNVMKTVSCAPFPQNSSCDTSCAMVRVQIRNRKWGQCCLQTPSGPSDMTVLPI